ncbi:hypothetical protein AAFF_G00077540 [Aldrovandia affinis]|uniref:Uncharacterized protein n=1 Tax=Aldrovandia affinis TaxID=143900 RepID=A0AAD7WCK2_9TELE|nr:hypothetical protein AAFF_G00077540 [Aldrovandia affinis]
MLQWGPRYAGHRDGMPQLIIAEGRETKASGQTLNSYYVGGLSGCRLFQMRISSAPYPPQSSGSPGRGLSYRSRGGGRGLCFSRLIIDTQEHFLLYLGLQRGAEVKALNS